MDEESRMEPGRTALPRSLHPFWPRASSVVIYQVALVSAFTTAFMGTPSPLCLLLSTSSNYSLSAAAPLGPSPASNALIQMPWNR